jgi:hypothetical protein
MRAHFSTGPRAGEDVELREGTADHQVLANALHEQNWSFAMQLYQSDLNLHFMVDLVPLMIFSAFVFLQI